MHVLCDRKAEAILHDAAPNETSRISHKATRGTEAPSRFVPHPAGVKTYSGASGAGTAGVAT
jgi:hypothetical protein